MIWSKFLTAAHSNGPRRIITSQLKDAANSKIILRHGGGGHRIMRTRAFHKNFYTKLFFQYFLVGAIPAALIIMYTNLFVGNAVLHDHDPEIYEPRHWEYYKHPITRFLAKYCMEDPVLSYYKEVYVRETMHRDERQIRLVRQVRELQKFEQSGMIPWQEQPELSRSTSDDLTEFIEKKLKKEPE